MKPCIICKEIKDLDEFNKHPQMKDGRINKCKACEHEYKKKHYRKHKEVYINRAKATYKRDPQKVKDRVKKWQKDNPKRSGELKRKASLKYYYKNKAKVLKKHRIHSLNYLARKKNAVGKFTRVDVDKLYVQQRGKCFYCGEALNNKFDIEHKIPLKHGGTNWPANLALACRPCNTRKGTKSVQQFQELLKGV